MMTIIYTLLATALVGYVSVKKCRSGKNRERLSGKAVSVATTVITIAIFAATWRGNFEFVARSLDRLGGGETVMGAWTPSLACAVLGVFAMLLVGLGQSTARWAREELHR